MSLDLFSSYANFWHRNTELLASPNFRVGEPKATRTETWGAGSARNCRFFTQALGGSYVFMGYRKRILVQIPMEIELNRAKL